MGLFTTVFPFEESASADFFISYLCLNEKDGHIATLSPVLRPRRLRGLPIRMVGLPVDQD